LSTEYEVIVVGGGIAGFTAGLASARLGRSTLVLTGDALGGHLISIEKVEGYPGFPEGVPGYDLCPIAQEQAAEAGAEVQMAAVGAIEQSGAAWKVATPSGALTAQALIVASGTALKTLDIPGEADLRGKGVSHCASCDAPLLKGQSVVVVGGGDSAMQEALTLAEHVADVVIVHRGDSLTGQATFRDRIAASADIALRGNSDVVEILGEGSVEGVRVRDAAGAVADLEAAGVFVYIGLKPNTAFLDGCVELAPSGHVPTDAEMRTRSPGLLAAGTVRAGAAGRAVCAAAEGTVAALAADAYLQSHDWPR